MHASNLPNDTIIHNQPVILMTCFNAAAVTAVVIRRTRTAHDFYFWYFRTKK